MGYKQEEWPGPPAGALFLSEKSGAVHIKITKFFKPICSPCQRIKAAITALSVELKDQAAFGMIDAGNNPLTDEGYNITAYPSGLCLSPEIRTLGP